MCKEAVIYPSLKASLCQRRTVLPRFKLIILGALARHTYRHVERCSYSHLCPLPYNSWACLVPLNSFFHIISSLQFILLPSFSKEKKMQVSLDCWETFELNMKKEDYFRLPLHHSLKSYVLTQVMLLQLRTCAHIIQFMFCAPRLTCSYSPFQKIHKLFYETSITKKRTSTGKLHS